MARIADHTQRLTVLSDRVVARRAGELMVRHCKTADNKKRRAL